MVRSQEWYEGPPGCVRDLSVVAGKVGGASGLRPEI